jgi:ribonuclease HII
MPDFSLENLHNGTVCGLDEVGRGPLAGPVVAACVYVPDDVRPMSFVGDIKDSKKLGKRKLAELYDLITQHCVWSVAEISPAEIDQINILQASLKAMATSCRDVHQNTPMIHALVDGNKMPQHLPCPATTVVKGDGLSTSIAAASIVAKVTRDRIMSDLAQQYPHYGWDSNAAYPAPVHLQAIKDHGITPHHRKNFAPVRRYIEENDVA